MEDIVPSIVSASCVLINDFIGDSVSIIVCGCQGPNVGSKGNRFLDSDEIGLLTEDWCIGITVDVYENIGLCPASGVQSVICSNTQLQIQNFKIQVHVFLILNIWQ